MWAKRGSDTKRNNTSGAFRPGISKSAENRRFRAVGGRAAPARGGDAAGFFFAAGVIGVGFPAVPIKTTGAAYDLCRVMGWRSSLHARPKKPKRSTPASPA
jgi:hypothetical protein